MMPNFQAIPSWKRPSLNTQRLHMVSSTGNSATLMRWMHPDSCCSPSLLSCWPSWWWTCSLLLCQKLWVKFMRTPMQLIRDLLLKCFMRLKILSTSSDRLFAEDKSTLLISTVSWLKFLQSKEREKLTKSKLLKKSSSKPSPISSSC